MDIQTRPPGSLPVKVMTIVHVQLLHKAHVDNLWIQCVKKMNLKLSTFLTQVSFELFTELYRSIFSGFMRV